MEPCTPFNRRAFGENHEELALVFLEEKGLVFVERNFHFGRYGEIDLVMRDRDTLVFVEVKARRSHRFGTPEDAVDRRKRAQIRKVARGYVHLRQLIDFVPRFDVIAIDYVTGTGGRPEIRHLVDAFR